MKLVYLTAQKYPSGKTDPIFWRSMAEAFSPILERDFIFVVRDTASAEFNQINTVSVNLPWYFRSVSYFLYMPVLILSHKWNNKEVIFFSADSKLLSILIFWRKIFGFKYRICSDWHQLFGDWRDQYVSAHSDYLISTTKRLKDLLVSKCKVDSGKILVAYGGTDKSMYVLKSKIGRQDHRVALGLLIDKFLVGYIGGFRSVGLEKGIDTMIKSLSLLEERVTMVFVGGSPDHIEDYKLLARSLGVEDKCIFVEKQPFEKVVEYELAMDTLVIPYPDKPHFREFGFPMKVWEYLASGRPVIYSNLPVISEVLDGRAVPFRPDDPESLKEAIDLVMQGYEVVQIQAEENARDEAYTWSARAKNIVDFINHT